MPEDQSVRGKELCYVQPVHNNRKKRMGAVLICKAEHNIPLKMQSAIRRGKARQLALEEIFLVLILQEDRQESSQG